MTEFAISLGVDKIKFSNPERSVNHELGYYGKRLFCADRKRCKVQFFICSCCYLVDVCFKINVTFYNNKDAYSNILPNFAPNYLYLLTS